MINVYFSLGANLGNKEAHLLQAIQEIEKRIGKRISLSAFYATEPWGFFSEHSFLNAVMGVETDLTAPQVLMVTQQIERELGRSTKSAAGVYADRVIDIDVLLYGDTVLSSPELTLPHPLMAERLFVMEPLAEIAPNLLHPVYQKTMRELLAALRK